MRVIGNRVCVSGDGHIMRLNVTIALNESNPAGIEGDFRALPWSSSPLC